MMLPGFQAERRRKRTGLIAGALISSGYGAYVVLTGPPPHLPVFLVLGFLVIANAGVVYYAWPATDGFHLPIGGRKTGGRRADTRKTSTRNGGPGEAPSAPTTASAPTAASGRPVLRAVAWLMPRAAARRWLAEVESLLFELPAGRRARAVRSYVLCAPRLAMMMWTRHLSCRTNRRA